MAITPSDLELRFSAPEASAGDQQDQDTPGNSLGRYVSNTIWAGGVLHDLFGPVTGDANLAGTAEYRCVFIVNRHTSLTWRAAMLWFSAAVTVNGATFALGIDPTIASVITDSAEQARATAVPTAAPAGVTFSAPLSKSGGLSLGDIPPGYCKAFWFRRTAMNTGALAGQNATIAAEGDTL